MPATVVSAVGPVINTEPDTSGIGAADKKLTAAFGNEGQVEGSSTSTPQKRIATKGKRKAAKDASTDAPIHKKGKATRSTTAETDTEI
ncbi:hypothetical protein EKO27_g2000 [Xylaria grammica]|uniref:Uncharacterized protein n=1 Tax=Xylaria grammica TaxID=363999 RepID=A0A439DFE6_9PEZI|nr:hypothetical protein EKO27_g2000 [Xylaria grammica]